MEGFQMNNLFFWDPLLECAMCHSWQVFEKESTHEFTQNFSITPEMGILNLQCTLISFFMAIFDKSWKNWFQLATLLNFSSSGEFFGDLAQFPVYFISFY